MVLAGVPGTTSSEAGDSAASASACTATLAVVSIRIFLLPNGRSWESSRAVRVAVVPCADSGTVTPKRTVTVWPAAIVPGAGPSVRTCQPSGASS